MNKKRIISIFLIATMFTLLGITKTYASEQKITEITSSSTQIKQAISGEKIYNPQISIDSVNPSDAKSNLRTYYIWYLDGEEISKEQIENNNIKFEQGRYQLFVYFKVIDKNKNTIDYEKFPQKIKLNGYEFSINTKSTSCVGYEITFDVKCNLNTKPAIKTESIPNGNKMMNYSVDLKACGSETITWILANESKLPKGLSINKSGRISGISEETGEFTFEVEASNNYGKDTKKYKLKINDIDVITSAKISSTQLHKPQLGEKMYFPQINIDDVNIKSAKENCYTYAYWEHNGSEIRKEDKDVTKLKFEQGEYTLYVYFAIYPEKIEKNLIDYNKFSNDNIKLNGINFVMQEESLYYIGYSTTFKVNVPKPKKVEGLYVKSQTEDEITLKWSKNNDDITGYKIYYYDYKKNNWVYSGKTSNTTYKVENLRKGTTYKFRVRAYKTISGIQYFGSYSNKVRTATKPQIPSITEVVAGKNKVTIEYNKASGASGYEIEYATNQNFKDSKATTRKSSTTATIKGLTKGKKYYFRVRAYRTVDGNKIYSSYSNTRQIKVK